MIRHSIMSLVLVSLAIGSAVLGAKPRSDLEAKVKSQIMARVVMVGR